MNCYTCLKSYSIDIVYIMKYARMRNHIYDEIDIFLFHNIIVSPTTIQIPIVNKFRSFWTYFCALTNMTMIFLCVAKNMSSDNLINLVVESNGINLSTFKKPCLECFFSS